MGRDPFEVVVPRAQRLLVSQHAGLVEVFDAAITNDPAKMRYYIKAGVDLEGRDHNEDRPLHVAVAHENYKVAKILLVSVSLCCSFRRYLFLQSLCNN